MKIYWTTLLTALATTAALPGIVVSLPRPTIDCPWASSGKTAVIIPTATSFGFSFAHKKLAELPPTLVKDLRITTCLINGKSVTRIGEFPPNREVAVALFYSSVKQVYPTAFIMGSK